jgi:DNA invertase Pin-like site-specific DNA recombinase
MATIQFAGQTLAIDHAYSYARVSSKQQTADQGGKGIDRQELLSQEWSARHGVPLDYELRDLGRSGSKGHHLRKGAALGAFLDAVKGGQITPNSTLLVESFSRLSRLQIDDALTLFLDLIRSGVTLITLQDQSAYTRRSIRGSAGEMHKVTALMQAARTEAEFKAFSSRRSWKGRRQRATRQCPSWLVVVDHEYVATPKAVAIIIYIFVTA